MAQAEERGAEVIGASRALQMMSWKEKTVNDDTRLMTVPEAAKLLRISRNLAYELVARGEIPAIRLGRVIRVPRGTLEKWLMEGAREGPDSG